MQRKNFYKNYLPQQTKYTMNIIPMPPKSTKDYVMGVDTYDKDIAAVCVISKNKSDGGNMVCEYISRPRVEDLDAEIKRMADFYKIPDSNILKETD